MRCPCIKCEKRMMNCHASCMKYKEWKTIDSKKRREYALKNSVPLAWSSKEGYYSCK